MADRSRSRSPDRGAPSSDDHGAPAPGGDAEGGGDGEEVKLYVGNLDYGTFGIVGTDIFLIDGLLKAVMTPNEF